jgi:hypothetical protein
VIECELETHDVTQRERSEAVDAAWQTLAGWQAKLEACRERRGMLEEMIGRQEGFSDAARKLLAESESESARAVPGHGDLCVGIVRTERHHSSSGTAYVKPVGLPTFYRTRARTS